MIGTDFETCARASMPVALFNGDWGRIGHLADYFGAVTGACRADPTRHANLYATVLNELLELAVRCARPEGLLRLNLSCDGPTDRIELAVDCEPATGGRLRDRIVGVDAASAGEALHAALLAQDPIDPCIGIWEIVADFGGTVDAKLEVEGLKLQVDLRLEEGP